MLPGFLTSLALSPARRTLSVRSWSLVKDKVPRLRQFCPAYQLSRGFRGPLSGNLRNSAMGGYQSTRCITSMQTVAASGGYYAAVGTRKIYANPGTFTVSIGVIMEFVNTEKLLSVGKAIDRFAIKSGKLKDVGSPFRPISAGREKISREPSSWTSPISSSRARSKSDARSQMKSSPQYADGRVIDGTPGSRQSSSLTQLGTFDDALRDAKKMAKLPG